MLLLLCLKLLLLPFYQLSFDLDDTGAELCDLLAERFRRVPDGFRRLPDGFQLQSRFLIAEVRDVPNKRSNVNRNEWRGCRLLMERQRLLVDGRWRLVEG